MPKIRASQRGHRRWPANLAAGVPPVCLAVCLIVTASWMAAAARAQNLEPPVPEVAAGNPAPAPAATGNKIAVFSGLDKITAQISRIEATTGEPVQFGTLEIIVRECNTRPPEETPETTAFVEVAERRNSGDASEPLPLFTGWMFASSPGLNALEHPVYDVWLINCKIASGDASSASR